MPQYNFFLLEHTKPDKISVQIEDLAGPQQPNHTITELRNNPKSPIGALKEQNQENESDTTSTAETSDEDEPSVVRQNLLG
jgi:hypothetical protein